MSYSETLAKIVSSSDMSLREIADGCKALGVNVDPSYISKLQSGKQQAPSEEITIALAKVCKGDSQALLYEGNMDKAPESFKLFISKMIDYLRQSTKVLFISQVPADMAEMYEQQLDKLPDYEFINVLVNSDTLKIPDEPIIRFQDDEENQVSLVVPELVGLVMPDDSMMPLLPQGSRVQIKGLEEAEEGDIVVVKFNDDKYFVRRYNKVGNKIILIPENRSYEPVPFDKKSMKIVGKVKSVSFDI